MHEFGDCLVHVHRTRVILMQVYFLFYLRRAFTDIHPAENREQGCHGLDEQDQARVSFQFSSLSTRGQ